MKQSKLQSLVESVITVGSGLIVAVIIQLLIFPLYDHYLADLMNLNNAPLGYFQGSESTPIQRELYGPSFRVGLQYDF